MPPISNCIFAPRAKSDAPILRPTGVEPVKVTPETLGCETIASPTSAPVPITRLNTPSGKPARAIISDNSQADPGTSSAGLKTTVLP